MVPNEFAEGRPRSWKGHRAEWQDPTKRAGKEMRKDRWREWCRGVTRVSELLCNMNNTLFPSSSVSEIVLAVFASLLSPCMMLSL